MLIGTALGITIYKFVDFPFCKPDLMQEMKIELALCIKHIIIELDHYI